MRHIAGGDDIPKTHGSRRNGTAVSCHLSTFLVVRYAAADFISPIIDYMVLRHEAAVAVHNMAVPTAAVGRSTRTGVKPFSLHASVGCLHACTLAALTAPSVRRFNLIKLLLIILTSQYDGV